MQTRKIIGIILAVVAVLLLTMGIIAQFFSGNAIPAVPPSTNAPLSMAPVSASLPQGFQVSTNATASAYPLASRTTGQLPASNLLQQAEQFVRENKPDAALDKVNAYLLAAPRDPAAYGLRGTLYAGQKQWGKAESDFQAALQIDDSSAQMKFNLAEIAFAQKKYDVARVRYSNLQQDPEMGDFAKYKAFLCDLLGGHQDTAAQELDAFNQAGSNASYYFANAAWSLHRQNSDEARAWLDSAARIYAPAKFKLYADCLIGLGKSPQ